MSEIFRPMLAVDADLNKLKFAVLASPKLDGIRAVVRNGVVYSRSNKPIPNKAVQAKFKHLEHFDGELIFGDATSKTVYRDTLSAVMTYDGSAEGVGFYAFDHIEHMQRDYMQRLLALSLSDMQSNSVIIHDQRLFINMSNLLEYEESCLDAGFEGLILRAPEAPYKMGRSTMKEGYLLKLKRFEDAEATVIGFEERMHNGNEATTNELGRTKRSSHKENKHGRDDLGALVVRTLEGVEFNIGTGFTDAERRSIWDHRDKCLGQQVKYKHFAVGVKIAPRHPVYLGWRHPIDL